MGVRKLRGLVIKIPERGLSDGEGNTLGFKFKPWADDEEAEAASRRDHFEKLGNKIKEMHRL